MYVQIQPRPKPIGGLIIKRYHHGADAIDSNCIVSILKIVNMKYPKGKKKLVKQYLCPFWLFVIKIAVLHQCQQNTQLITSNFFTDFAKHSTGFINQFIFFIQ